MNCDWCGVDLGHARANKKYCGADCRKKAFEHRSHQGEVRSVRFLKSGRMSVVVWTDHDSGIRPGMRVKIAEDE